MTGRDIAPRQTEADLVAKTSEPPAYQSTLPPARPILLAGILGLTSVGTAAVASAAVLSPGLGAVALVGLALLTMSIGVVVLAEVAPV